MSHTVQTVSPFMVVKVPVLQHILSCLLNAQKVHFLPFTQVVFFGKQFFNVLKVPGISCCFISREPFFHNFGLHKAVTDKAVDKIGLCLQCKGGLIGLKHQGEINPIAVFLKH